MLRLTLIRKPFLSHLWLAESSAVTVSDNVKVVPWMPQNDVLGHPKTRLFIGHAGLNGIFESIYHGVPMILSPFFGDQFDNARFANTAGFAEVLLLKKATAEEFVSIIHKVLTGSRLVLWKRPLGEALWLLLTFGSVQIKIRATFEHQFRLSQFYNNYIFYLGYRDLKKKNSRTLIV